jgi:hypothetical protein
MPQVDVFIPLHCELGDAMADAIARAISLGHTPAPGAQVRRHGSAHFCDIFPSVGLAAGVPRAVSLRGGPSRMKSDAALWLKNSRTSM